MRCCVMFASCARILWLVQLKASGTPYHTGKLPPRAKAQGISASLDEPLFPFARVRRLMLGAGAVPAATKEAALCVCKAAELFIAAFVRDAASTAQRRGAKRTITGPDVATTARGVPPWQGILQFDFPEGSYEPVAAAPAGKPKTGAAPPPGAHTGSDTADGTDALPSGGMASFLAAAPRVAGHEALFAAAPPTAPPSRAAGRGRKKTGTVPAAEDVESIHDSEEEGVVEGGGSNSAAAADASDAGAGAPPASSGDAVLDAVRAKRRKSLKKTAAGVDEPAVKGAKKGSAAGGGLAGASGGLGSFFKGGQSKDDARAAAFAQVQDRDFTVEGGKRKGGKGGKKRGRAGAGQAEEGGGSQDSLHDGLQFDEEMDVELDAVRAAHGKKRKKRVGPSARSRAAKAAARSALNAAIMEGELSGGGSGDSSGSDSDTAPAAAAVSATAAEEDGDVIWPTGM